MQLVELLLDAKNVDLCIMSTIKIITRIALLLFLSLLIYQGLSESQSWLSQSIWFAFLGYILIDIVADFFTKNTTVPNSRVKRLQLSAVAVLLLIMLSLMLYSLHIQDTESFRGCLGGIVILIGFFYSDRKIFISMRD